MKTMSMLIIQMLLPLAGSRLPALVTPHLRPVHWYFRAEKTAAKTYELHLTAVIRPGWHLYAQRQPASAIALPTLIRFDSDPLLEFMGETREAGRLEDFKDPVLGIEARQYENRVDFIRLVKVKGKIPLRIGGSITYQSCTPGSCFPPETKSFLISIRE